MNKKVLGIAIPYFRNVIQCEEPFKKLMEILANNMVDGVIIYIYEDGQTSEWLKQYENENIIVESCNINYGVGYARNKCLDYLLDKVNYILFIDSDDRVDDDYVKVMHEYCADNSHDIIESGMYIKDQKIEFNPKLIRCGVAGSALKTSIIGKHRFNESLNIAEDTNFMEDVIDLSKHRKKYAKTFYYYQLGINNDSLTMKYQRNEISKVRK